MHDFRVASRIHLLSILKLFYRVPLYHGCHSKYPNATVSRKNCKWHCTSACDFITPLDGHGTDVRQWQDSCYRWLTNWQRCYIVNRVFSRRRGDLYIVLYTFLSTTSSLTDRFVHLPLKLPLNSTLLQTTPNRSFSKSTAQFNYIIQSTMRSFP